MTAHASKQVAFLYSIFIYLLFSLQAPCTCASNSEYSTVGGSRCNLSVENGPVHHFEPSHD